VLQALEGSVLSEWGMFTYQSATATQAMQSAELGFEFAQLLGYAHEYKIAKVYLECLMDHPHKSGHTCYFDRQVSIVFSHFLLFCCFVILLFCYFVVLLFCNFCFVIFVSGFE
jgi:hypothetical protein